MREGFTLPRFKRERAKRLKVRDIFARQFNDVLVLDLNAFSNDDRVNDRVAVGEFDNF